jgi:ADP-ribosylglycohydrolase
VPEAIIAFLESTDYENAIRLAISLGGDSDTIACITGGIAEAYYGQVPDAIAEGIANILPAEFVHLAEAFALKYGKR